MVMEDVQEAEKKEITAEYILLTYDIPAKEKKLRRDFLKAVKSIGAMEYTASVYLLPFTAESLALANSLNSKGHAVVWTAQQPDKGKATEIYAKYAQHLKLKLLAIQQRLTMAQDYIQAGHMAMALKMGVKTGKLLQELAHIQKNYNQPWFETKLQELVQSWKEVYYGGGEGNSQEPAGGG